VADITDEMVEKALLGAMGFDAVQDDNRPVDDTYLTEQMRAALSAALEGCAVVDLPPPNTTDSEDDPAWTVPGLIADTPDHIVAYVYQGHPLVSAITAPDDPDTAESYAVALLAAVREARRMAGAS